MPHTSTTSRGKLLRISSQDKSPEQTNSNFSVILNNASFVQSVRGIIPKTISFKHVFPNIFGGNSTFSFVWNGTPSSVSIPEAWYDANSLASILTSRLLIDPIVMGAVSVITFTDPPLNPVYNQKFKFVISGGSLTLQTVASGNPMGDVLGIGNDTISSSDYVPDYLPDLGGISTVYLCSSEMAGNNAAASSNGGEQVQIITEIPIDVPFGSQVYYRAFNDDMETIVYPSSRSLTKVSIQLCTRTGAILDLKQHTLTALFKVLGNEYFAAS